MKCESRIANNGNSVIINVEMDYGPYTNEAIDTISEIRETIKFTLNNTDLHDATALVGGVTAGIKDLLDTQRNDFIFIIIIVIGAIYIILALLMRSLVSPIYMVGTIVLSFATTMGITYAIFKYAFGYEGLVSTVPIYGFVILIALGVDYNIFLMSRIRYEFESGKTTKEAIRDGLSVTGSIITSCGIIMAGTFAAFLVSPMKTFLELGVAIVVGLILDTFIIRTLLVPSIAIKVGELNWWPKRKIRVTSESRTKQK
ncbi:MMPL family transporter [Lysinibacillus fusiformis]